jgi:hypothetical protein
MKHSEHTQLARVEQNEHHIPIARIWQFVSKDVAPDVLERAHVLTCQKCHGVLRACMRSTTLDEACREAGLDQD